jgi:NADH-quinone oxidoreductase subunit M
MCLASKDIKRIVAYSSVSQMGYVIFGLATATPQGVSGGLTHVISHGLIKMLLFMTVGIIMTATGRRYIDEMGGLWSHAPGAAALLAVGALAIAGLPLLPAFVDEWMILSGGIMSPYPLLGYLQLPAYLLTTIYALWLVTRVTLGSAPEGLTIEPVPRSMLWSAYAVIGLSLAMGLYPTPVLRWAGEAAALLALGGP